MFPVVRSVILSRTDNLGDVVLSLPMAGYLKERWPGVKIYFIGKAYTRPLIEASAFVDQFLDREALLADSDSLRRIAADAIVFVYPDRELARLAKAAGIPNRVGTSHRWYHWWYCNRLVNLSRRSSDLHESQLNLKLLKPLGLSFDEGTESIARWYGLRKVQPFPQAALLRNDRFKLIIHPKSKGSAREWPLDYYYDLIRQLPPERYQIFVTGTAAEKELIHQQKPQLFEFPHLTDLTGKLSLEELISLIQAVDGLVACSTGPLHIASALGKYALGIYPPMRPLHPERWGPVGPHASFLRLEKNCEDCRKTQNCACIRAISVAQVKGVVEGWVKVKYISIGF